MKEWDSHTHTERGGNKSEKDEVGARKMMRWSEATTIKRHRNVFRVETALYPWEWANWNTPRFVSGSLLFL